MFSAAKTHGNLHEKQLVCPFVSSWSTDSLSAMTQIKNYLFSQFRHCLLGEACWSLANMAIRFPDTPWVFQKSIYQAQHWSHLQTLLARCQPYKQELKFKAKWEGSNSNLPGALFSELWHGTSSSYLSLYQREPTDFWGSVLNAEFHSSFKTWLDKAHNVRKSKKR